MNLFKSRNRFEKQLQQKMRLHEVKPGDSLWDRIASELPHDEMEQKLRTKLNEFEKEPDQHLWHEIEHLLYKEDEQERWWKYAPLLLLLAIAAVAFIFISLEMYEGATKRSSKLESRKEVESINTQSKNSITKRSDQETTYNKPPGVVVETSTKQITSEITVNSVRNHKTTPRLVIEQSKGSNTSNAQSNKPVITVQQNDDAVAAQSSNTYLNAINPSFDEKSLGVTNEPQSALNVNEEKNTLASSAQDSSIHNKNDSTSIVSAESQSMPNNKQNSLNEEDDGPSRFSIGIVSGANYCIMQLRSPESNLYPLVENTQLRKSIERPQIDLAVQFLLQYHLNQHWAISTGVGRLLFRQTFFYNVTDPSIAKDLETLPNNAMYAKDSIIAGNNFQSEIRYSWTELPVGIHYQKQLSRKIQLHIQSGITYAVLANADVNMVNYDNIGVLQISNKNEFPTFKNSLFIHGGAGVMWRLNQSVNLSIQPHFRVGMNNMVANKNWVEQRPFFIGMQFGIFKRL
jgi:hypothetical protein